MVFKVPYEQSVFSKIIAKACCQLQDNLLVTESMGQHGLLATGLPKLCTGDAAFLLKVFKGGKKNPNLFVRLSTALPPSVFCLFCFYLNG